MIYGPGCGTTEPGPAPKLRRGDRAETIFNLYGARTRAPDTASFKVVPSVSARRALCDIAASDSHFPETLTHHADHCRSASSTACRARRRFMDVPARIDARKARSAHEQRRVANGSIAVTLVEHIKDAAAAVLALKEYARAAFGMSAQGATDFARNLHATVNSFSGMRS
jgi:hypothetical protein